MTDMPTYESGLRAGEAKNAATVERYRELLRAVRAPQAGETPTRSHRLAIEKLSTTAVSPEHNLELLEQGARDERSACVAYLRSLAPDEELTPETLGNDIAELIHLRIGPTDD